MEVITDPAACPKPASGSVVTIGAYDGVHLGHRAVIAEVRRRAAEQGCVSAVVTFDRHPAFVVRPESAPKLLTDLDQRLELLASTGLDYCLVVHFDEQRSRESAEDFVTDVLSGCLTARVVVVGEDFHFGHRRRGNVELLKHMGAELGFGVDGLPLVRLPGLPDELSSTAIRVALARGDLPTAARMLGRSHEVRGMVEGDARRGATQLGFPTANVTVAPEIQLPAEGIYAGWYVRPDGSRHKAAISFGRRPTFYEGAEPVLEAHLLDFHGDLYGELARVQFVSRLRAEERFESPDALVEQMTRDVEATRQALS